MGSEALSIPSFLPSAFSFFPPKIEPKVVDFGTISLESGSFLSPFFVIAPIIEPNIDLLDSGFFSTTSSLSVLLSELEDDFLPHIRRVFVIYTASPKKYLRRTQIRYICFLNFDSRLAKDVDFLDFLPNILEASFPPQLYQDE